MKISIVTATYNNEYELPKLYQSILEQKEDVYEWIICDDYSSDSTFNQAQRFKREGVIKIEGMMQLKEGARYAASLNNGFRKATGDVVFAVNGDAYLKPGCLKELIKSFNWGSVGSALRENVDKDGNFLHFDWRSPTGITEVVNVTHAENPWGYLTGNGMIVDRKVFDLVGYWDQNYIGYDKDDHDFFMRCSKAGVQLFMYNNVRIFNLFDEPPGGKPDSPETLERFNKKLAGEIPL